MERLASWIHEVALGLPGVGEGGGCVHGRGSGSPPQEEVLPMKAQEADVESVVVEVERVFLGSCMLPFQKCPGTCPASSLFPTPACEIVDFGKR